MNKNLTIFLEMEGLKMSFQSFCKIVHTYGGSMYVYGESAIAAFSQNKMDAEYICVTGMKENAITQNFSKYIKKQNLSYQGEFPFTNPISKVSFSRFATIEEFLEEKELTIEKIAIPINEIGKLVDEVIDPYEMQKGLENHVLEQAFYACEEDEYEKAFREYVVQVKQKHRKRTFTAEEFERVEEMFQKELKKGLFVGNIFYKFDKEGELVKSTLFENPIHFYKLIRMSSKYRLEFSQEVEEMIRQMKTINMDIDMSVMQEELKDVLKMEKPSIFFEMLDYYGMLDVHFKEMANMKQKKRKDYERTMKAIDEMKVKDEVKQLSILLHLLKKEEIHAFLQRFSWVRVTEFVIKHCRELYNLDVFESQEIIRQVEPINGLEEEIDVTVGLPAKKEIKHTHSGGRELF